MTVLYGYVFAQAAKPVIIDTIAGADFGLEPGMVFACACSPAAAWREGLVVEAPCSDDSDDVPMFTAGASNDDRLRALWRLHGHCKFSVSEPISYAALRIRAAPPPMKPARTITLNFGGPKLGETPKREAPSAFR